METRPLDFTKYPPTEMESRSAAFLALMKKRHSVRQFAPRPVPMTVIRHCLAAAGRAPSGANQQPWHFVVVSDPTKKHQIRLAAEAEERAFYNGRAVG
jgi:iodotyrosine deiodinase